MTELLRQRAWLMHSAYNLIRVVYWLSGESPIWSQTATMTSVEGEQQVAFNEQFVEDIRPYIRYIALSLLILSVILDLAIIKCRSLADAIIYLELCACTITFCLPSEENFLTESTIAMYQLTFFLMFYTGRVAIAQIVFVACAQLLQAFLLRPLIYE